MRPAGRGRPIHLPVTPAFPCPLPIGAAETQETDTQLQTLSADPHLRQAHLQMRRQRLDVRLLKNIVMIA